MTKFWQSRKNSKIGGLLYLIAIYVIYSAVCDVSVIIYRILNAIYSSEFTILFKTLLTPSMLFTVIILTFAIIGLLKEKSYFPAILCSFAIYSFCKYLSVPITLMLIYDNHNFKLPLLYYCELVIPWFIVFYMIKSKRVKTTFIN